MPERWPDSAIEEIDHWKDWADQLAQALNLCLQPVFGMGRKEAETLRAQRVESAVDLLRQYQAARNEAEREAP